MENVSPTRSQQARAEGIAAELAASASRCPEPSSSGTSAAASPAAAATPTRPVLHGPYWQWTRKVAGKTITRLVPDDQLDDYRQWLDNHRRLRALVAELEALTLAIADDQPREKTPARTPRPRHPANHHIKLWTRTA